MVIFKQIHDVQPILSYYRSVTCPMLDLPLKQRPVQPKIPETQAASHRSSMVQPIQKEVAQAMTAEKHKLSERKRRCRINIQYATLSSILPHLIKKNKASVLAEAIQCIKELKKRVSKLETIQGGSTLEGVFPSWADKLRVRFVEGQGERLVKVMISCEDTTKLMLDIAKAMKSVEGKVVRAEMVTMGGRTKCVLWVQGIKGSEELGMLKTCLSCVTERRRDHSRTTNKMQCSSL